MKKRQDLLPILSAAKGGKRYSDFILSTKPLAYWPLDELSGSVAYDRSGNGFNGSYTGVTLGQPGQDGPCPYFDGASGYCNVYSAGLANAFNGSEGTAAMWMRVYNASVWNDATFRSAFTLQVDADNGAYLQKYTTAGGRMSLYYEAGATGNERTKSSLMAITGWFHIALTWSKSGDAVKAYWNGAQEGATLTGLGVWAGVPALNKILIGAVSVTPAQVWHGWLQHAGLWTRALSAAEINALYTRAGSVDSDYIAYDTFTRANGALGSAETLDPNGKGIAAKVWTGATWAVSSNAAINTPTLGDEIVVNGDMELDSDWGNSATPTTNERSNEQAHGGTYSRKFVSDAINDGIAQAQTWTLGAWYKLAGWLYIGAGSARFQEGSARVAWPTYDVTTTGSWLQSLKTGRCVTGGAGSLVAIARTAISTVYVDDVSIKPITTTDLFSSVVSSIANVTVNINLTVPNDTQAGCVVRLDSASSPANFIIAYISRTSATTYNARLDKCVGGTYTNLIDAAITYSAGATLMVIANGSSVSLYYNNAQVGTTQTVADAGILNNTLHGKFSTYDGNTLDNFGVRQHG